MAVIQALVLLTSALLTSGQRPSFAGSRPIGYPELVNRTTTPSGLEDKFGEGTTQRLPIEAQGDRELVDRLSKLPIDKQPFWFINWQAYEANRNKPQTYPQRPNPFLEGNFQNTADLNTNPGVANANNGVVNTNPPQPVITKPVNNGNVTTDVKPPIPNNNTGGSGLNTKSGDSELGNRYATESTTVVSTAGLTNTNKNIQEPVKSNVDVNNDGHAKKPDAVTVEPSNLNDKNVPSISIPYYKDVVEFDNDDQDKAQGNPNIDSNTNNKKPELKTGESGISTDNTNINTVEVSDQSDTIKSSNYDNVEAKKSKTDPKTDGDVKKPDIKVNKVLTDTNINSTFHSRDIETPTELDYYEDLEVKKVIKLYPGIIPLYQR